MIRYAPYIDGTIPAFTDETGIVVPFTPNKAVKISNLDGSLIGYLKIDKNNIDWENNISIFKLYDDTASFYDFSNEDDDIINGSWSFFGIKQALVVKNENIELIIDNERYQVLDKELKNLLIDLICCYIKGERVKETINDIAYKFYYGYFPLIPGQFYKVQLAYYEDTNELDYNKLTYSTVGITKYIGSKATLDITNVSSTELEFNYKCDDNTENLDKYEL